jgi:hypothetical protein
VQSHMRTYHHRTAPREAGAALRWGAVIALVLMLGVLAWAVRRGESPGVERPRTTAVTGVEAPVAGASGLRVHTPGLGRS